MTSMAAPSPLPTPRRPPVPPLQNGDRLTRPEFERRYEAMPQVKKAELLEGVVYMGSPVNNEEHGAPHAEVVGWLVVYQAATPGVQAADNSTVRLDLDNEPQPDGLLRILPANGGKSRTSEDGYIVGATELAAEIAASSVSYDLHVKLNVYRRAGVQEYVVWRVWDGEIDWFALREGQYVRLGLDATGWYKSEVFPGLWLDPAALLRGDLAKVLEVLQQGLRSPEHEQFVAQLQARTGKP